MGSLILLLNNDIETKFKGWDTTQSTPQKTKNKQISCLLVFWYLLIQNDRPRNKPTPSKSSEKSHFRPHDFMYITNWQLKEFLTKFA